MYDDDDMDVCDYIESETGEKLVEGFDIMDDEQKMTVDEILRYYGINLELWA